MFPYPAQEIVIQPVRIGRPAPVPIEPPVHISEPASTFYRTPPLFNRHRWFSERDEASEDPGRRVGSKFFRPGGQTQPLQSPPPPPANPNSTPATGGPLPQVLRPLHPREFTASELAVIRPSTKSLDEMLRIGRRNIAAMWAGASSENSGNPDTRSIDLGYDVQMTSFSLIVPPWDMILVRLGVFRSYTPQFSRNFTQVVVTAKHPTVRTVILDAAVYVNLGLVVIKNPLPDNPIFNPPQPNRLRMEDILNQVLEKTLSHSENRHLFDLKQIVFVQIPKDTGTYHAIAEARRSQLTEKDNGKDPIFRIRNTSVFKETTPKFAIIAGSDLVDPVVKFRMLSNRRFVYRFLKNIDIFKSDSDPRIPPGMNIMLDFRIK